MKNIAFIITFGFISSFAFASTTICKLEESLTGIKAIAWEGSTLIAKVTDSLNNTHLGKVTLISEHKPFGEKINVLIKYPKSYYGDDAAEYAIFPTGENKFRVIGVTYVFKNNEYHLSTSEGNYSAICLSM